MKKLVITLACMLTLGAIQAQEKKNGMINEFSVSIGNTINYSSMSLFQDATTDYSSTLADILIGYRFNNNAITLTYEYGTNHTSALHLNEQMEQNSISLGYKNYTPLNEKMELFVGGNIGIVRLNNTFNYNENHYDFKRWGTNTNISIGLQYKISKTSYWGISFKLPAAILLFDNEINLPSGLENNPIERQTGYQITLTYGMGY